MVRLRIVDPAFSLLVIETDMSVTVYEYTLDATTGELRVKKASFKVEKQAGSK